MATNVAKIQAELDLDSGKFHGAITTATGQLKTFNAAVNNTDKSIKNIERRVTGLGASLRDTMIVLGQFRAALHTLWAFSGQWVAQIIEANAKLERLQQLMKGLSRASTEAGKVADSLRDMNYVLDKAKNAPFTVDVIADSFVKLKASGIDPTLGSLDALIDGVARFGGSSEQLHRATIAIQQMSGKGVISMEELRQQLGEAIPNAMQLMARGLNMTMGEMVKAISTGRVEAKSALEKLFVEMKKEFDGSAENMMNTWTGLTQKLKTEWMLFAQEIGRGGLFESAKQSLRDLMAFMASDSGRALARDIGYALNQAIQFASSLAKWLVEHRNELVTIGKLMIAAFVTSRIASFTTQIVTMVSQVGALRAGFMAMTTQVVAARTATAGWSATLAAAAGPIGIAVAAVGALVMVLDNQYRASIRAAEGMAAFYRASRQGQMVSDDEIKNQQSNLDYLRALPAELARIRTLSKVGRANALNGVAGELIKRGLVTEQLNESTRQSRLYVSEAEKLEMINGARIKHFASTQAMLAKQYQMQGEQVMKDGTQSFLDAMEKDLRVVRDQASNFDPTKAWEEYNRTGNKQKYLDDKAADAKAVADAEIKYLQAQKDGLIISLNSGKFGEGGQAQLRAMIEANTEKLKQAYENRAAAISSVSESAVLLPKMGNGQEGKKPTDEFMDLYQTLSGKAAELQARLDGGIPKLERFRELVKQGEFTGNSGLIGGIEALYKAIDDLEKKVKEERATETLRDNLTEMEAKAKADVITASMEASGDIYSQVSAGMVGFNRQVEVLRANLDQTKMSREDFDAWVLKIKGHIAEVDFINFNKFVEDAEWENYLATLPDKARNLEEFNRKLVEFNILRSKMTATDPNNAAAINDGVDRLIASETRRFAYENRSEWQKWMDDYRDISEEMEGVWSNALDGMAEKMTEAVTTGKASFRDLATSILKEITRILVSKAITQLVDLILQIGGGWFKGGNTASAAPVNNSRMTFSEFGNIMTPKGPAKLNYYANGGIADSPQLSVFGEGRMPEAYVPLPDGRSIPVTMEGASGGTNIANSVSINVQINQDGSGTSDTQSSTKAGEELGRMLDTKVKQVLSSEMRPGGILWRMTNG